MLVDKRSRKARVSFLENNYFLENNEKCTPCCEEELLKSNCCRYYIVLYCIVMKERVERGREKRG